MEESIRTIQVEQDGQKGIKRFTEELKGMDNALISKRVDDYKYYPSGCIDTIELKEYKGNELISKKRIKHFKDGKQPIVK